MVISKPRWWDYAEFYPYEDEPDYDGVHDGGIKGLREDTPPDIKAEYEEFVEMEKDGILF